MLSRIGYPTGGYVDYDFKANKALPPPYFSDLDFNGVNPVESKSAGLFKNYSERVENGVYESGEFTVGYPVSLYITANFTTWGSHRFQAQVINSTGSVVQNIPLGSNNNLISNFTNPGVYKIRVKTQDYDDPYDLTNSFSVLLSWNESIPQSELIYSGGNRIRKIVIDNSKGETIEKEYIYDDENGLSSGRVYSMPCYNFVSTFTQGGITFSGILKPGTPLTYNQGNHIGYSSVTEYLSGNNGLSGKTEYFYTSMYDEGAYWMWPFTVPDDQRI